MPQAPQGKQNEDLACKLYLTDRRDTRSHKKWGQIGFFSNLVGEEGSRIQGVPG